MEEVLLKQVPLFNGLKNADLKRVAAKLTHDRYPRETVIFMEEDEGSSLFIIRKGRVKISRISEDGREVILAILKDTDFFGEMSLLDGQSRSANVMAIEDSDVLVLRREDFMALVLKYPEISIHLLKELARRLRQSDAQIKSLSLLKATSRVAAALVQLSESSGSVDGISITIPFTPSQKDLANMAGTSRETISRTLKQFIDDGLLSKKGRMIVINNLEEFKELFL